MKFRFLLITFIISQWAAAQTPSYNYITKYDPPKSPNASAFEKYLTVPGNYETGQVNPVIPLMGFSLDGVDVPINLNYSSTGLKLTDVATWVGQGWNLNVGGTVTRVVKGIPDDNANGLLNPYYAGMLSDYAHNIMTDPTQLWNYFRDIAKQNIDSEHDIFYYSALGTKGSFYINASGKCVKLPKTNDSISFTRISPAGPLANFTVINDKGDKFFFNIKEASTSVSNGGDNYYNQLAGSTWYLSRIQTKNNQIIDFTYSQSHYSKIDRSQTQSFGIQGASCFAGGPSGSTTDITNYVNIYQLSKITWKSGYINFNAGTYRTDLTAFDPYATQVPYLAGIDMFKTDGTKVQSISFDYTLTPRLSLNNVNFKGNGTTTDHHYSFTYVPGTPAYPSPFSSLSLYNAQDYWGYYNGIMSNYELMPFNVVSQNMFDDPASDQGYQHGLIGLNSFQPSSGPPRNSRVPNPAYAAAGMLQEIYYPTGGKTKFYYEGNMISRTLAMNSTLQGGLFVNSLPVSTDAAGNTLVTLGGVRVKTIEFYSDPAASPSTVTNVVYDPLMADVKSLPSYVTAIFSGDANSDLNNATCTGTCTANVLFTVHSSSVTNVPSDVVEYEHVTEFAGNDNSAGQTVHYYNNSRSYLRPGGATAYRILPYPTQQYLNYYAKEASTSSQLPSGASVLVKGSTNLVNDPALATLQPDDDSDLKIGLARNDACAYGINIDNVPQPSVMIDRLGAVFRPALTGLVSESYVEDSETQSSYAAGSPAVTDITNYNFNITQKNRLLPNSISKVNSKGETIKTLYSYPQEYFPTTVTTTSDPIINGLVNLIDSNVVNVPVEQLEVVNKAGTDYVTGGSFSVFLTDRLAISKIYRLALSQPIALSSFIRSYKDPSGNFVYDTRYYQLEKQYYSFNAANQPVEFSDRPNGVRHSLIWDYKSTYVVADVTAAPSATQTLNLSDIACTSFEADGNGNWTIGSALRNTGGLTGKQSYSLSNGSLLKSGLSTGTKYVVSYWTRGTGPLSITGTQSGYPITGLTLGGWTYYQHVVTGQSSIMLSGSVVIDEVKLYPQGAQAVTYTYEPLVGMTSMTDAKDEITYYTYDSFNRLLATWDQRKNLLKSNCYNYQGTTVNCPVPQAPNTTPGATTSGVYVHWEQGPPTQTSYSDGAGDVLTTTSVLMAAHFYSDAACTLPLTLTQGITLELDDSYTAYNALTNATTYGTEVHGTYTVPSGVSTYSIGGVTILTDYTYYDSYGNYLDNTQTYYYNGSPVSGSTYILLN